MRRHVRKFGNFEIGKITKIHRFFRSNFSKKSNFRINFSDMTHVLGRDSGTTDSRRLPFGFQAVLIVYSRTYWTDLPLGSRKQNAATSNILKFRISVGGWSPNGGPGPVAPTRPAAWSDPKFEDIGGSRILFWTPKRQIGPVGPRVNYHNSLQTEGEGPKTICARVTTQNMRPCAKI